MTVKFIGTRITAARERLRWKQADLARKIDVTGSAVNQWESGETTPNSENIGRLAVALEVPFEWLATGRGSANFGAENPQNSQLSLPIDAPAAQINHVYQILARLEAKIDALAKDMASRD